MTSIENQEPEPIDEEVDPPLLSSQALEALAEFLSEQQQPGLVRLETQAVNGEVVDSEVPLLSEDWRLSQVWYDCRTSQTVAMELIKLSVLTGSPVACIACPTLYAYLKKFDPSIVVQLFEYDKRFEQYGSDCTFYDYNQPEELPLAFKHSYRVVVADPPYLSKECLQKVSQTMHFLAQLEGSYLLLLTGEVQEEIAAELLGLYPCGFRPEHTSKLGNEFRLYTDYDPVDRLGGWEITE